MTILDTHGYPSLHINMSLLRYLKYSIKEFKMKKDFAFLLSEVTMDLSLRMLSLYFFLKEWSFPQLLLTKNSLKKWGN